LKKSKTGKNLLVLVEVSLENYGAKFSPEHNVTKEGE